MATVPKFRIDVDIHDMLTNAPPNKVPRPVDRGRKLPEPVFPQFPEKLRYPGPETPPEKREWTWPRFSSNHCVSFR
jgi:hypothetical protein